MQDEGAYHSGKIQLHVSFKYHYWILKHKKNEKCNLKGISQNAF